MTIRYNKDLLKEICKRDNCEVDFDKYDNLSRDVKVTFTCGTLNCDKTYEKTMEQLYKYNALCSVCKNERRQARYEETMMEKYNVVNSMNSPMLVERQRQAFMDIYGFPCSLQAEEVKQKIRETNLRLFGYEYAMQNKDVQEKQRLAINEQFGVDNVFQNKDIIEKIQNIMVERYGYAHALQISEFAEKASKNAYLSKPFTFPCGNVIHVQGYEHFALELLVQQGKTFEDITTDRRYVPEIWYELENKKHRYFCDIFMHKEHKIIEVKSTWTFEKKQDNIPHKAQACLDEGFEYEIWIFDGKKNLKIQNYDKPIVSFSEKLFL